MSHPASMKHDVLGTEVDHPLAAPSTSGAKSVRLILFSLSAVFAYYASASYISPHFAKLQSPVSNCSSYTGADADPEAVWGKITPGTVDNLPWTPCYDGLVPARFCAKLAVPLDYAHPEGEAAIIALIKVPAAVPPTDKAYKGPILINPGGPGASGVDSIKRAGGMLQQLFGSEFDFVGFDPRGVARTHPQIVIFPDEAESAQFHLQLLSAPLWNTTIDAVSRMHANHHIIGSLAEKRASVKHAASHVGTALVARDMLSITRVFGREKLQFWGFSYGTILGATFAAMFPDKVERILIDGVADADEYYKTSWKKNFLDTDKGLHLVLHACVDAGPQKCALFEPTANQVHARLTKILENLKRNPVAVLAHSGVGPSIDHGIVDYKSARTLLFMFLYSPYSGMAPTLMSAFRALEDGKGEPLWNLIAPSQPPFSCSCKPKALTIETPEAVLAIACGDGLPVEDTVEELEKGFYEQSKQTEFAELWQLRPRCAGWKVRPVERFAGPWVANTSHPLLLIGNTADPVTPLAHAHTMSQGFKESVVLTQESAGHCSVASPSICTAKAIRAYFRDGILPAEGTVCNATGDIFDNAGGAALKKLVGEDLTIMEAWSALSGILSMPRSRLPLSNWLGI